VDVLDDEVLSNDDLKSNINKGEEFSVEEDFSKLQNLSPEDFKTALNFSINCAAKAE
jgi:pterin-4a-carbinolamine dehydratase